MRVLKNRIEQHLGQKPGKDDAQIYLKSFVIILWMLASFISIFLFENNFIKLFACISYGISNAGLGFNLFHDAIHGSLSSSKKVNHFFSFLTCALLGPGHYFWRHKHNYLHHQYPNIKQWDDDLETREGLRLSPHQAWAPKYKFQHLYAPFIYGLTTLEWFFVKDYINYFTLNMNEWQRIPKMKLNDHLEFWFSKMIYYSLTVLLPLCFFSIGQYLVGFVLYHFCYSLTSAAIFQLAHVMQESDNPVVDPLSGELDRSWALLQLTTTVNFAPHNKFVTWFAGGLNFQIEHHLFPNISHYYYPQFSAIVKRTCQEFDYPYYSIPTYWQALKNHFKTLRNLGDKKQQILHNPKRKIEGEVELHHILPHPSTGGELHSNLDSERSS